MKWWKLNNSSPAKKARELFYQKQAGIKKGEYDKEKEKNDRKTIRHYI